MKRWASLLLAFFLLVSCQSRESALPSVTFQDGEHAITLVSASRIPGELLEQAGIQLAEQDLLLYNGEPIPLDQPLPEALSYSFQVRRAVEVTIQLPGEKLTLQTAAFTVAEALQEAGIQLDEGSKVEPPIDTSILAPMTISIRTVRELVVTLDGQEINILSTASSVGEALADGGIPLLGLDYSIPADTSPLPADGRIQVVRVVETIALTQKALPFTNRFEGSAELEIDQQELLQVGEAGLALTRTRIRTEDGVEVSRLVEGESIVRPSQDRILGYGTHVELKSTTVDGVSIKYWRAVSMYATSYSPCRSGVPGRCFTGTALGLPVKKGVVAMLRSWYNAMAGQSVYIPGYGQAIIADIGGGFPDGRRWIDLGYSDDDWVTWSGWVTVYFLAPIPDSILYVLP